MGRAYNLPEQVAVADMAHLQRRPCEKGMSNRNKDNVKRPGTQMRHAAKLWRYPNP